MRTSHHLHRLHPPQFSTQSAPIAFRDSQDWSELLQLAQVARKIQALFQVL
jgi:hypothetical protein